MPIAHTQRHTNKHASRHDVRRSKESGSSTSEPREDSEERKVAAAFAEKLALVVEVEAELEVRGKVLEYGPKKFTVRLVHIACARLEHYIFYSHYWMRLLGSWELDAVTRQRQSVNSALSCAEKNVFCRGHRFLFHTYMPSRTHNMCRHMHFVFWIQVASKRKGFHALGTERISFVLSGSGRALSFELGIERNALLMFSRCSFTDRTLKPRSTICHNFGLINHRDVWGLH